MREGGAAMTAWNCVRRLKYDDGINTARECGRLYIHHTLADADADHHDHRALHAAALRELFTKSGWEAEEVVEQLERFLETSESEDDGRINIREDDDDMKGSPVLFHAMEAMATEQGVLRELSNTDKIKLLRTLVRHGAHWLQPNTWPGAFDDELHSAAEEASAGYPVLNKALKLQALAKER